MKKQFSVLALSVALAFLAGFSGASAAAPEGDKIVLAYVASGNGAPIEPVVVTHINYAFGTVKPTFDGVDVQRPEYLREITALKGEHKHLKVLLSIGGWGAGGFSEMADNDTLRGAFVADCKRIAEVFNLDGIDLDWEYPGSRGGGITAGPRDVDNFTKLMAELRKALGKKRLLTFASSAGARHIDFPAVMPYVDFVNLMCYDMGRPAWNMHHSALYPSARARWSVAQSVEAHRKAGVPNDKIVVGVPFYGHANVKLGYSDYINWPEVAGAFPGQVYAVDSVAGVPYVADSAGTLLCVYDDPESLLLKCRYVLDNGLRGVMYWEYSCDDAQGTLRRTVYEAVITDNKFNR